MGPSTAHVLKVPRSQESKMEEYTMERVIEDIMSTRAFGILYWESSSFLKERKAIVVTDMPSV